MKYFLLSPCLDHHAPSSSSSSSSSSCYSDHSYLDHASTSHNSRVYFTTILLLLPCIYKVLPTLLPILHHRHLPTLPPTMLCCLRLCPIHPPRLPRSPHAHHRPLTAPLGTGAPLYRSFTSSSDTPLSRQKSISVAVLGAPNAGKSTLVNAIVGRHVSAVSPRAQTTRGVLLLLPPLLLLHRAISHRAITASIVSHFSQTS